MKKFDCLEPDNLIAGESNDKRHLGTVRSLLKMTELLRWLIFALEKNKLLEFYKF
jgi:hypothetical protein